MDRSRQKKNSGAEKVKVTCQAHPRNEATFASVVVCFPERYNHGSGIRRAHI